jgi:predicted transcriptional regulator
MKYKFEKIDNDTTRLSYKEKEFKIKRDVELTKKIQGIYMKARTKMMVDLAKEGITKKDLVIERKENGKTYYDNSNITEIEQNYIQMASLDLYNEICKSSTNMAIDELMEDIGLNESEAEKFGNEFSLAIQGKTKTPSKE